MIKVYVRALPGLCALLPLPLAIIPKGKKKALWIVAYISVMKKVVNSLQCIASITALETGEIVLIHCISF